MTKGEKIRSLREQFKLTQTELAKRLNTTKQNIYKYENNIVTNIPSDKIEIMADIFSVSPAYIMGWESENDSRPLNIIPANISDYVNIPVIGKVAAGIECFAEDNIVDYEPVSPDDITEGDEYAFLKVVGDSMEPQFREGDLVLIRVQPSVDSGSYAVVIVDDENGLVKRVIYDKNWIELQSLNSIYAPRRFEGSEVERIRVFGLVKALKRKF